MIVGLVQISTFCCMSGFHLQWWYVSLSFLKVMFKVKDLILCNWTWKDHYDFWEQLTKYFIFECKSIKVNGMIFFKFYLPTDHQLWWIYILSDGTKNGCINYGIFYTSVVQLFVCQLHGVKFLPCFFELLSIDWQVTKVPHWSTTFLSHFCVFNAF